MASSDEQKVRDYTRGPVTGPLLSFALPILLSGILQLLFNAADIVVVGQFVDDKAVAAVGSNVALINLLINLFVGISLGATVVIATDLGAGRSDIRKGVHTAYTLGIAFGFLTMVLGLVFSGKMLEMMKAPAEVIDQAALYLRIYFIGQPGFMIFTFGRAILTPTGDTRHPLYYLIFAGIVNVILNLILVIVFGLGVAGVAIATITSQAISAVLMTRKLMVIDGPCHLSLRSLCIDRWQAGRMLRLGIPMGLQSIVFSLSNVLIQKSVNSLGAVVMAGNAAAMSIEGFVFVSMNAVSQGAMTFAGQNYGAGRFDRMKKILVSTLFLEACCGIILGGLCTLFGKPFLRLYLPQDDATLAVEAGFVRLLIICLPYFTCGLMDSTASILRGMNRSVFPMVTTIMGVCGLRVVWVYTVFAGASSVDEMRGYALLLISYPITWVLTFIVLIVYFFVVVGKMTRKPKLLTRK